MPIHKRFKIHEISKLFKYKTYFIRLHYFAESNLKGHFVNTDSFVLKLATDKLSTDSEKIWVKYDLFLILAI